MADMELNTVEKNGIQIISISGKIMGGPEDDQVAEVFNNLVVEDKVFAVLDLSQLTWMNSNGLGMCLGGLTRLRNRGGDLRIAGMPPMVKSLMNKCRILHLFQCYESVEAALESF